LLGVTRNPEATASAAEVSTLHKPGMGHIYASNDFLRRHPFYSYPVVDRVFKAIGNGIVNFLLGPTSAGYISILPPCSPIYTTAASRYTSHNNISRIPHYPNRSLSSCH